MVDKRTSHRLRAAVETSYRPCARIRGHSRHLRSNCSQSGYARVAPWTFGFPYQPFNTICMLPVMDVMNRLCAHVEAAHTVQTRVLL
jgi:hypothetical protein